MKLSALYCLLIGLLSGASDSADRPNIVLILSDDQGWTDYGFMDHPDIRTPHLDKLAERSLTFDRGYVAAPLCRPSLASMVTGLYPHQHGITGNDVNGHENRAALDVPLREAFHKHPSFVKLLTANGYLTHQSGKWWEGSRQDGGFTHGMTHGDPAGTLQYLWCVEEDWKLLVRHHGKDTTKYHNLHVWDTEPVRLYNVQNDPHERKNLAEEKPEIVASLKKWIDAWWYPGKE